MSVSLPSIGGGGGNGNGSLYQDEHKSHSFSNVFNVAPIMEDQEEDFVETRFADTVKRLTTQPFPTLDENGTMKNRISALEHTVDVQSDFNKLTHRTFVNLNTEIRSTEEQLKDAIAQVQNSFELKLAAMKKEYDHRFELQANENKRLQNHVASLKADTTQLKKKLHTTIQKVRKLQMEFGDGEDPDLEDDAFFNATASMSFSRPPTGQI